MIKACLNYDSSWQLDKYLFIWYNKGLNQLGMEYIKPMPVEDRTSMLESIPAQVPSCEAGSQRL